MFHGPVFEACQYIDAWDDLGSMSRLRLRCRLLRRGHTPQLILNPVLLDCPGQVVACWLVQFFGTEFNNFPPPLAESNVRILPDLTGMAS